MKSSIIASICAFLFSSICLCAQEFDSIKFTPNRYEKALKNPMMGFTVGTDSDAHSNPWASTKHVYIKWNDLENDESDGIEKILNFCEKNWRKSPTSDIKIIPRVYLHYSGNKKFWPKDMQNDDYSSKQFKERLLRLIERLGICWDNDPSIAFVEMGIFGKWGEHHSPSPSKEMQEIVGEAFAKSFKNKKVSVRHVWSEFTEQEFGEYWDSWAHFDQMWTHGNSIKKINDTTGRYKKNYIGGEVAYDWGNSEIQPGNTPTESVSIKKHRDFIINTIRWLHCTQFRWIDQYDKKNPDAIIGAEEIQKALGYRYEISSVEFSMKDFLNVSFSVINTGSAPFYYKWPVEVSLLDSTTLKAVWTSEIKNVDIRTWLPGESWTDPDWNKVEFWRKNIPEQNWNKSGKCQWAKPPQKNEVNGQFKVNLKEGTYILAIAILDPAGDLPNIKFACKNYLNGGRHPMGLIHIGKNKCSYLPKNFKFDEPNADTSLHYKTQFNPLETLKTKNLKN